MTEAQRAYLADLAGKKGIILTDTDNKPVAWASAKIEELKAMPDATFRDVTPEEDQKINALTQQVIRRMYEWGFLNE